MREIIQSGWKSEGSSAHSQWREEALCTVQQDIQSSCYLEDSLADSLWQEATQMLSVRKIIQWIYKSEETSAGTLWREGSQVCKMREIIQSGSKSEDSLIILSFYSIDLQ